MSPFDTPEGPDNRGRPRPTSSSSPLLHLESP